MTPEGYCACEVVNGGEPLDWQTEPCRVCGLPVVPPGDGVSRIILCGTDSAQPGDGLYFIGYSDLVDGYRHAYAGPDRFGRVSIKRSRTAGHPSDSRCPGCRESAKP